MHQKQDQEITTRFVIEGYESEDHAEANEGMFKICENSKKNGDYPKEKSSKIIVKNVRKYIDGI